MEITTHDELPRGCPDAPLVFSVATATPEVGFYRAMAEARVEPPSMYFNRHMDDITLVTAPSVADVCFVASGYTLIDAGVKLNGDNCTERTTDGIKPETPLALALWSQT